MISLQLRMRAFPMYVLIGLLMASSATGQQLSFSGARPILKAVDAARAKYGIQISYEDTSYNSRKDVGPSVYTGKDGAMLQHPFRPIIGSAVTVGLSTLPSSGAAQSDALLFLTAVVHNYNQARGFDNFSVTSDQYGVHVRSNYTLDQSAHIAVHMSPMSAKISLPSKQYTVLEVIKALELQSARQGIDVWLAFVPNIVYRKVVLSADQISGAELMGKLFQAADYKGSWSVLCSPGLADGCALNLSPPAPSLP